MHDQKNFMMCMENTLKKISPVDPFNHPYLVSPIRYLGKDLPTNIKTPLRFCPAEEFYFLLTFMKFLLFLFLILVVLTIIKNEA
jgi:hypothetical protein